jgi:hypothetical protein
MQQAEKPQLCQIQENDMKCDFSLSEQIPQRGFKIEANDHKGDTDDPSVFSQ